MMGANKLPAELSFQAPTSVDGHWLLSVIAPGWRTAATLVAMFRHVLPDGRMKLCPDILRLLDAETLKTWAGGCEVGKAGVLAEGLCSG